MAIIVGWCELKSETKENLNISYSPDNNPDCDGLLVYNKITQLVKIEKLSEGASEYWTKHFICPLRSRIRKGMELNKRYLVIS